MNKGMTNEVDYYRTSDLGLASTIALFYPIETINKQNPRKAEFVFRKEKSLDALVEQYWRGLLQVEPQAYFQQLRLVKARLYGER